MCGAVRQGRLMALHQLFSKGKNEEGEKGDVGPGLEIFNLRLPCLTT